MVGKGGTLRARKFREAGALQLTRLSLKVSIGARKEKNLVCEGVGGGGGKGFFEIYIDTRGVGELFSPLHTLTHVLESNVVLRRPDLPVWLRRVPLHRTVVGGGPLAFRAYRKALLTLSDKKYSASFSCV